MNRREFLLLRAGSHGRSMELSCERLYMKYLDAHLNGVAGELIARLDEELRSIDELRLVDTEWLSREDLSAQLDRLLAAFRARGGRVAGG